MCRNIKILFNFDPPATDEEIESASTQYVRKLSGVSKPSKVNEKAFNIAVTQVTQATKTLIFSLETTAKSRNREIEAEKAHQRGLKRFNQAA